ncbi:hypothetical protein MHBO_001090 [Bonamia ostreae]|uniref:proton-translocating NAD(P)(+) transhydrogenase n=1 Tax=Bonamia ostreae TaxID=126728 RepID=A0ABV2AHU1_9EUKA
MLRFYKRMAVFEGRRSGPMAFRRNFGCVLNGRPLDSLTIGIADDTKEADPTPYIDPENIKLFTDLGFKINVEASAGKSAHFSDKLYELSGAKITDSETALKSDLIFKSNPPNLDQLKHLTPKSVVFWFSLIFIIFDFIDFFDLI